MNNKGFTLIELIMSFAIASVIIVLLINIVLSIRTVYIKSNFKTDLIINQSNLLSLINEKINSDNLLSYNICSEEENCYEFHLSDGTTSIFKINYSSKIITFDSFIYKLDKTSSIGDLTITKETVASASTSSNDSILIINLPITDKLFDKEDFGINVVYPYNSIITPL